VAVSNPYLRKVSSSSRSKLIRSDDKGIVSNLTSKTDIHRPETQKQVHNDPLQNTCTTSNASIGRDVSIPCGKVIQARENGRTSLPLSPPNSESKSDSKKRKNAAPVVKSKKKKKLLSAAASFKAHLRKEITHLKKQKKSHITHNICEKELLERKYALKKKEVMRNQRLEQKQEREVVRQQRKEEKRLEKERHHNIMKDKLTRDLEQRQVEEAKRLERKRQIEEEREATKLRKLKERDERKILERERKKKEMEDILEQVRARQLQQEQQQLQMHRINAIPFTHVNYIPTENNFLFPRSAYVSPATVDGNNNTSCHPQIPLPPSINNGHIPSVPCTPSMYKASPLSPVSTFSPTSRVAQSDSINTKVVTEDCNDSRIDGTQKDQLQYDLYRRSRYQSYQIFYNNPQWYNYQNPHTYSSMGHHPVKNWKENLGWYNPDISSNSIPSPLLLQTVSPCSSITPVPNFPIVAHGREVREQKKEVTQKKMLLYKDPLSPPSPFLKTHKLLPFKITICKEYKQTFGVDIRYDTRGTLIERQMNCNKNSEGLEEEKEEIEQRLLPKTKRKRLVVGVMTVVGATEQNNRADNCMPKHDLLQGGDIILEIDGRSVGDLSFQNALGLFAMRSNEKDGIINVVSLENYDEAEKSKCCDSNTQELDKVECVLTVARENRVTKILNRLAALATPPENLIKKEKKVTITKEKTKIETQIDTSADVMKKVDPLGEVVPFVVNEKTDKVLSGEFTPVEFEALVMSVRSSLVEVKVTLGEHDLNRESFHKIFHNQSFGRLLLRRDVRALVNKWYHETNIIDKNLIERAHQKWKAAWTDECENITAEALVTYMSDSQRAMLRFSPRPVQGCKCGSMNHEHVNHPECVLYRNLKKFETSISYKKAVNRVLKKTELSERITNKVNSIGKAHTQRSKNYQEEDRDLNVEALFVNEMECIQVENLQTAIFAPHHLTTLVISTIASLSEMLRNGSISMNGGNANQIVDATCSQKNTEAVSLLSGAKILPHNEDTYLDERLHLVKRQKNFTPHSFYLAHVLRHISVTWGHIYKDLIHVDYAW